MRKIKEVLRLKWACEQSERRIAKSCAISRSAVAEYLRRARNAGLSWPLPDGMDDGRSALPMAEKEDQGRRH